MQSEQGTEEEKGTSTAIKYYDSSYDATETFEEVDSSSVNSFKPVVRPKKDQKELAHISEGTESSKEPSSGGAEDSALKEEEKRGKVVALLEDALKRN